MYILNLYCVREPDLFACFMGMIGDSRILKLDGGYITNFQHQGIAFPKALVEAGRVMLCTPSS